MANRGRQVSLGDDIRVTDRRGVDVTPRLRKVRAVIAILALTRGHRISRRDLTALLWSDRGPEQARASLRQCLFTLRSETPALAEADGEWVWLAPAAMIANDTGTMSSPLARLIGLDPALDRWLAELPGGAMADTRVALPDPPSVNAPARRRWLVVALSGAIVLAVIMVWWWRHRLPTVVPDLTVIAIAPFTAVPNSPVAGAIAKRMSDDIRALLPADRAVVRVSETTGNRAGSGRELGAEWVISGNVNSADGSARAHVQIDTTDGRLLWTRDFDAAPGRAADVAATAATRIAMATGCALGGPRVHRDADVLALLFTACDRLDFSADNYNDEQALVAEQKLAEHAPEDALAQAFFGVGLAVTAEDMPPAIAQAQRLEAVHRLDRAQRLDPRVGEAWIGRFLLVSDDRARALKESLLARGLAVEPNNALLNLFMAELLADVGRDDEGLVFAKRSAAFAPAFLVTSQFTSELLSVTGRPREALAWLDVADRRFPRTPGSRRSGSMPR